VVAVNNPPGFYSQSGFPAVVIPDGDDEVLLQVVNQFGVDWVLLDSNHPSGLTDLYQYPTSSNWLELIDTLGDNQGKELFIFRVRIKQP
jgi:hypothetical protein